MIIPCMQTVHLGQDEKSFLNYELVIPSVTLPPDTESSQIILLIKKYYSLLGNNNMTHTYPLLYLREFIIRIRFGDIK